MLSNQEYNLVWDADDANYLPPSGFGGLQQLGRCLDLWNGERK